MATTTTTFAAAAAAAVAYASCSHHHRVQSDVVVSDNTLRSARRPQSLHTCSRHRYFAATGPASTATLPPELIKVALEWEGLVRYMIYIYHIGSI